VEKYFLIGAVIVSLAGAFTDVRSARIPNKLTYSSIVAAILLRSVLMGLPGVKSCGLGILVAGGCFTLLFVIRAMGGGDLKMMTAIGAWVGGDHILTVIIAIGLAGGLLAIASAMLGRNTIQTVRNTVRLTAYRFTSGLQPHPEMNVQAPGSRRIPFGLAIAAGTLFCVANVAWWR
jgi:prepilin peptidase CpaA